MRSAQMRWLLQAGPVDTLLDVGGHVTRLLGGVLAIVVILCLKHCEFADGLSKKVATVRKEGE